MKTKIFAKLFKQSPRRALYWAVCVLLVLTVLTSWSISGVYAKYVYSAAVADSAGVANMGISKFELKEHYAEDISDDLAKVAELGTLYKLDLDVDTVLNNSYSTVIPGVDIPKDPFINLVLTNNEINYELYVKVDESDFYTATYTGTDGKEHRFISYELDDVWRPVIENDEVVPGLYKYVGAVEADEDEDVPAYVFKAGTKYNVKYSVTDDEKNSTDVVYTSIHILKGDKLKVSEHFNSEVHIEFSLTFTAYLQQVINNPSNNSETDGETP